MARSSSAGPVSTESFQNAEIILSRSGSL